MGNRPIILNPRLCNGCGACAETCPDLFGYDKAEQQAMLKADQGPEEAILEAMAC